MKNENALTNLEVLKIQLKILETEHKVLDDKVSGTKGQILDPLLLSRLKKEKLLIKDKIIKIQDKITPDIIA